MNKNWLKIGSLSLRRDLLSDIVIIGDVNDGSFTVYFKFNNAIAYRNAHFDSLKTAKNRKSQLKKEIDEMVIDRSLLKNIMPCIEIGSDDPGRDIKMT